jgi:hypothetical protein
MKYERPEVVALQLAIDAIRGSCIKSGQKQDGCVSSEKNATPAAYEADE